MRVVVLSHKTCWADPSARSGYATDGGFAKQMDALAELFDELTVCVPVAGSPSKRAVEAQSPFNSGRLRICALGELRGSGMQRRLWMTVWLLKTLPRLAREVARADAVHAPIPGDIGTFGIVLAELFRRPLFVRYCGNWFAERTRAERGWHWYMRRFAGGRRVMLATGGAAELPHPPNPSLGWIFSASLRESELPQTSAANKARVSGELRLVTVGRQEPYKGTGAVIGALPALLETYPRLSFHVVGDGSGLGEFRRLAERAGVGDQVVFHGATRHDQVIELLQSSHVFVFPTAGEGFPKAVAEALACGTPVVTSPVSVLPTLISESVGALLENNEPDSIVQAVRRVYDEAYPDRCRAAAELGATFTLDRWRDEIGEVLVDAWGPLRSVVLPERIVKFDGEPS